MRSRSLTSAALAIALAAAAMTGCGGDDAPELGVESSDDGLQDNGGVEEGATDASGSDGATQEDASGDGGGSAVAGLTETSPEDVCLLVPEEVAEGALGAPVGAAPQGQSFEGLGVNCIWETAKGFDGPQVKVEFNTLMWEGSSALAGADGEEGEIDGHDTVSYTGAATGEHILVVKLGDDDEPALYIEAPDASGAEAVAQAVLESLE